MSPGFDRASVMDDESSSTSDEQHQQPLTDDSEPSSEGQISDNPAEKSRDATSTPLYYGTGSSSRDNDSPSSFEPPNKDKRLSSPKAQNASTSQPPTQRYPSHRFKSDGTLSPIILSSYQRLKSEFHQVWMIGKGGFGKVYHVKHVIDNQDYAVKVIPVRSDILEKWGKGKMQELQNILLRETRTLARIEHCNVVRYYNAWIEFVEDGETGLDDLDQKLKRQLLLNEKQTADDATSPPSHQYPHSVGSELEKGDQQHPELDKIDASIPENSRSLASNNKAVVFASGSNSPNRHSHAFQSSQNPTWTSSSSTHLSSTDTGIFLSGDLKLSPRKSSRQPPAKTPVMALYIQMSLHPLNLTTYLSLPTNQTGQEIPHHCFHLLPSLRLFRRIVLGVEYLHSEKIIHRDLKPSNILLSTYSNPSQKAGCVDITCHECPPGDRSRPKVLINPRIGDFGLATDLIPVTDEMDSPTASKPVGTALYASPSSVFGDHLDVFSLGIILFELVYRMATRMERSITLANLHQGRFPADFLDVVEPRSSLRPETGSEDIVGGEGELGEISVGMRLKEIIENMTCVRAEGAWGCAEVRKAVDDLVRVLEERALASI